MSSSSSSRSRLLDPLDQLMRKISRDQFLVLVATFGSLSGAVQGFITTLSGMMLMDSVFLREMSQNDPTFTIRFIVLLYAGEIVGAMLSFALSDLFGRRTTLSYTSFVGIFLLIWNGLVRSPGDFLTSRFFLGWLIGIQLATAPLYTSEIAMTVDRGYTIGILALTTIGGSLASGFVYFFLRDVDFGWRICTLIPILFFVAQIIGLSLVPESPRWLLALRTPAECLESMRTFRRVMDVSKEFNDIYIALSSDARLGESWFEILSSKTIRYRIFICCLLQLSNQMLGIQIITTYGSYILNILNMHSIVLGLSLAHIAAFMGTLMGLNSVDIWGRRFLLISGCVAMAVSWLGAAACVYSGGLEEGKAEIYFPSYILRFFFGSFLCLFAFSYAFSVGPICWIVPAELFPLRARGKASSLTTACHAASALLDAYLLQIWLSNGWDLAAGMLVFAGVAMFLGLLAFVAMPETRGLMLEDMEDLFAMDPGMETCLACFPVPEFGLVGFRTLSEDRRRASRLRSNKKSEATNAGASSDSLFEPASLHKYSTPMREIPLEYFGSESEPLIPANIVAVKAFNGAISASEKGAGGGAGSQSTGIYGTGTYTFPHGHPYANPHRDTRDRGGGVAGVGQGQGGGGGGSRGEASVVTGRGEREVREPERVRTHKTVTYSLIPDLSAAAPSR